MVKMVNLFYEEKRWNTDTALAQEYNALHCRSIIITVQGMIILLLRHPFRDGLLNQNIHSF